MGSGAVNSNAADAGATQATIAFWTERIIGVELDRQPGPDDWLVLALGHSRLVPIRTHPALVAERLGLVVYAEVPPSHRALILLAQLAAGDAALLDPAGDTAENRQWALATASRVAAALTR